MSASPATSFYWAMRLLPKERRQAMFALYAYCRMLDDIADGPAAPAAKRAALDRVRLELSRLFAGLPPHDPVLAGLEGTVRTFGLPAAELLAVIDGMAMDVDGPVVAPSMEVLRLYCRRVAGAVGVMAVRVFGRPDADAFAVALGEALQLTNILRDVAEDAAAGRIYLPAECLTEAGVTDVADPAVLPAHPALPRACAALAARAEERFREAQRHLDRLGRAGLWPAMVMMATYARLLERLKHHGWRTETPPPRLSSPERLWIALRVAILAAARP